MKTALSVFALISIVVAGIESVMATRAVGRKDFEGETRWRLRSLGSYTTAILLLVIAERLASL